jgi:hypothetical protein
MKEKKEWYCTTIEVRGSGRFPFDMLRYDNCVAVQPTLMEGREDRTVRLRRFSKDGSPATAARWNSFNWGVLKDSANGDII